MNANMSDKLYAALKDEMCSWAIFDGAPDEDMDFLVEQIMNVLRRAGI